MQPFTWPLFKRRVAYVLAPRLAWLSVLMVVLSLLVVFNVRHEVCIRWWGMLLQLIGVWAVVMELRQAQDKHGLGFGQWWERFRAGWPTRIHRVAVGEAVEASDACSARLTLMPPAIDPSAAVEARLTVLESHAAHFHRQVDRLIGEIDANTRAIDDAAMREAQLREHALAKLHEDAKVSDEQRLPFSFFGAGSLFVGVFLGTAAVELAKWVQ